MIKELYAQILEKGVLPVGDAIEGGGFMRWLRQYRNEQWLSSDELSRLQRQRIRALLEFTVKEVPYYKGTKIAGETPEEMLREFPFLTKTKINEHLDSLLAMPKESLIAESSSGSSGVQGTVYLDKSSQASQRAMQMLWFEWSGYQMGDSILQTGLTIDRGIVKGLKDLLLKTEYVPAFNLDQAVLNDILTKLRAQPRDFLFGYASSLNVLAEAAIDGGYSDIEFKYAVSWGDKLFPHYRKRVEQAFGCKTIDTYGCTEGAMIAAQCQEGSYHMSTNQCFVEIVDDDGQPVPKGELGRVVATRLDNYAMPLIRYDLGDLAILEPNKDFKCDCGRNSPLLKQIVGRDTDIVLTRSGKRLIVHFFTAIFEHIPSIKQFKVVQKNLDEMEIHYITGPGFDSNTTAEVERRIHHHLEEEFPITWKETTEIPATQSGKPQIVQSFLQHGLD